MEPCTMVDVVELAEMIGSFLVILAGMFFFYKLVTYYDND